MNSIEKYINDTELNLCHVESALDVAVNKKDQAELIRKKNKLVKKIKKLERKLYNDNYDSTHSESNHREIN